MTTVRVTHRSRRSETAFAYTLLAPVLIYLLLVMLVPFLWSIFTSMTDKMIGTIGRFIGLQNYRELLGDALFLKAIVNSLIFTIGAVFGKVLFGMIMALVLNENIRCRNLFRSVLLLPWTIPTIVSVFAWQWMFRGTGGVLNYLLQSLRIIRHPIGWLVTPSMAMFSVILVNVWRGIPFLGISILAGLQTISPELYEAARIDGANAARRFWSITLPQLRSVILLASLVTTIWTLNDFEIIWLLTHGGPSNGTQVFSTLSYTVGFFYLQLGKSIAISIFMFPLLVVLIHFVTKTALSSRE